MSTRSKNPKLNLLLESPGVEHLEIQGRKLPTYNQVLLCYLAHCEKLRREDKSKQQRIGNAALEPVIYQITLHYAKAGISLISEKDMKYKISRIHENYVELRKLSNKSRCNNPKLCTFRENLSKTMPLWPKDEINRLLSSKFGKNDIEKKAIDEDVRFLENMMTTRTGNYTSKDIIVSQLQETRRVRKREEEERASRQKGENILINSQVTIDDDQETEEFTVNEQEQPKRKHRRTIKKGVTIYIPHDIMKNENIVASYTRNKISTTAISSFLRTLITECGENPDAVTLGYGSTFR